MHSPEYIDLIYREASALGMTVRYYADNWAIEIALGNSKQFIVGYTFPLNDSACYKIIRNKNLCSEILAARGVPCVPHDVIYSPAHLEKHGNDNGNFLNINKFIKKYGFPILVKKNNSTKGEGVHLLQNASQLERTLAQLYTTEAAFCISPYRKNIREYRWIVLDAECLLGYEKHIPSVIGDGKRTVVELLSAYVVENPQLKNKKGKLFDPLSIKKMTDVPVCGEIIPLQWKHNRLIGSSYSLVERDDMATLALNAATAVNARFVTVDIVESPECGIEVLEINASVGLHFTFAESGSDNYQLAASVYRKALKKIFNLN